MEYWNFGKGSYNYFDFAKGVVDSDEGVFFARVHSFVHSGKWSWRSAPPHTAEVERPLGWN